MSDPHTRPCAAGRRLARGLLTASASLLAAAPAVAQVVRGTVIEDVGGLPIATAEVLLVDEDGNQRGSALTDTLGVFRIAAPEAGHYTLSVRRIGFVAVATPVVDVSNAETVAVEVRMSAEAIPLEPLVVVQRRWYGIARLEQFYQRADWSSKLGRGRIYYHDDVKNMISIRHLLASVPQGRNCRVQVLVDGLPVTDLDELDAFANPRDVEGVEIYRGPAQMPIEYAHMGTCGLALIWTRPSQGKPFTWKRFFVAVGALGVMVLIAAQ